MAKVITFSRTFPAYHPKKGQPTFFVEKFWGSIDNFLSFSEIAKFPEQEYDKLNKQIKLDYNYLKEPKHHTIRAGNRFKVGDYFSPRVWSGKPYNSKQIIIAPDIEVKKVWDFEISGGEFKINDKVYGSEDESCFELLERIAYHDGLNRHDLLEWLKYPNPFKGQIICWNENINY